MKTPYPCNENGYGFFGDECCIPAITGPKCKHGYVPFRYRRSPKWAIRAIRLLSWRWLIALAFRPGFRNPREAAVLEPDASLTLDAATAYFRQQIARIRSGERMTQERSIDGPYSHEQWVYIHLRHAELHLSFLALDGTV